MKYEIEINYSRELIKSAIQQLWIKWCLKHIIIITVLFLYALVMRFIWNMTNWLPTTLAALSIIAIFVEISVYFVYRHRSLSLFERMKSPQVSWCFDEDFISVEADTGSAKFKWDIIKKLWCFSNAWVFMYVNNTISILAIDSIPIETQEFVIKKIRENKGVIA
jgi:purine-cytosine permease-like protein